MSSAPSASISFVCRWESNVISYFPIFNKICCCCCSATIITKCDSRVFQAFWGCSWFSGGVPGFLGSVPGFLGVFRVFWGVQGFRWCSGFFGCSGMFRCSGVPGSTTCQVEVLESKFRSKKLFLVLKKKTNFYMSHV